MSSFLDRLRTRMSGMQNHSIATLDKVEGPPPRTREVIRTNRWDDASWRSARKVPLVDDLVDDLFNGDEHKGGTRGEYEQAPDLAKGVFQTFYKANPRLTPKRELERDLYPVRKIMEEMQANPRLKELQDMTMGDLTTSAIALDAMGDEMRDIITRLQEVPPPPPPGQPGQQGQPGGQGQPGDGQGGAGGGQADGQGNGKDAGNQGQGDTGEDEDLTDPSNGETEWDPDAEDALSQAETDWEEAYDEALNDVDFERLANKMLDAAQAEVEELDGLRKGVGLDDGEWGQMPPDQRLAIARRLQSPEMKELANVIGQMKRYALGVKATRVTDVPHEAYDVETGNDLRRLLRPQLALLATKQTSFEFYRRYTEKELLQYKMRGSEEVGKGPMVIAIDKSGSMGGAPFNWALGVAEALRRFAADEERDYYAMFFGANNDRERFEFPKGKGDFEKVMAFLSAVANGGTQFDGVLTEALERASKAYEGGKTKADIVFITDGMAHLDEAWIEAFNAERHRVGVRVYSVYIGGAYDSHYWDAQTGPLGLLNKISDGTINVTDLKPESVKQIFEKV